MSGLEQKILDRLAPHSREQHDFRILLSEWVVVSDCTIAERDNKPECLMCGHQHITYLYRIENTQTGAILDPVGSTCILKIDIPIRLPNGRLLKTQTERKKELTCSRKDAQVKKANEQAQKAIALVSTPEHLEKLRGKFASLNVDERTKIINVVLGPAVINVTTWEDMLMHVSTMRKKWLLLDETVVAAKQKQRLREVAEALARASTKGLRGISEIIAKGYRVSPKQAEWFLNSLSSDVREEVRSTLRSKVKLPRSDDEDAKRVYQQLFKE